jgi:hypothetical protein
MADLRIAEHAGDVPGLLDLVFKAAGGHSPFLSFLRPLCRPDGELLDRPGCAAPIRFWSPGP